MILIHRTKSPFIIAMVIVSLLSMQSIANCQIQLKAIGTYESGIFDDSAAEIIAHDPLTQRLFVVNAAVSRIDVLDINNPENPTRLFQIDVSPYGAAANSVAVHEGILAVAVESYPKQTPGSVAFLNTDGSFLSSVRVGALPDMLTFTPNGRYVLVANEGEPNGYCRPGESGDPEGSVSVIDISRGVLSLTQADVRTADFQRFTRESLHSDIRIFGPNATVSQDLEPEYITVADNSLTAWITLQENNAVAVLDIFTASIIEILPLGSKNYALDIAQLRTFAFGNLPILGVTDAGQEISLGGFSGLYFEGINPENGNLQFITHPDRGPNANPIDTDDDGIKERPFPLPDYQAQWLRFELSVQTGQIHVTDRVGLVQSDGTPISGLPNLEGAAGLALGDEVPIDLFGNPLRRDAFGADMEGIVRASDGTYWMVDEYRPAIYHFSSEGVLINRYVPEGSNAAGVSVGIEAIPAIFAHRRANRGFEAVAYWDGTLYAFLQSPIDNPDVATDANSKAGLSIRILVFDTERAESVGQYLYTLEGNGSDKIGDAVALNESNILVIERDSAIGPASKKKIFQIDMTGASNVHGLVGNTALESLAESELAAIGVVPVTKTLVVDLAEAGYDFAEKPEGLALIDENTLAVLNDNDFGLEGGFDTATGLLNDNPSSQLPILGLIRLRSNGLDPSDRDNGINISHWPVRGLYQPDAITHFRSAGKTYLITANEGDARDYECFSEETRVADLALNSQVFLNPDLLQGDESLGRLKTTTASGDIDGDGQHDIVFNYGARSFSIWTVDGELVFDSGDDFEQITARRLPENFNSTNDENESFDNRSDDKGPEPEGVTVGQIHGRTYAFIGFERVGGIIVYDVTSPHTPEYVQYLNTRKFARDAEADTAGDLGPEGLLFIDAHHSPTQQPMLVVGNEVSGTTTIYQIDSPAKEDFSHVFFTSLDPGLNMISLPLKPESSYSARSLIEELGATTVIHLDSNTQQFVGFTADAPDDGFSIEGGKGYIVNVTQYSEVAFVGAPWTNLPSTAPGEPVSTRLQGAWGFVVSGKFAKDHHLVAVRNTRTDTMATDFVRNGYFAAAFADLSQNSVIKTGDSIEIRVYDETGNLISDPAIRTVSADQIDQAHLSVTLRPRRVPSASALLQNYPNPFNPETWIPFQLNEDGQVNINIHDAQGRLVRALDMGYCEAGFHLNRSRAAYWDGRNSRNEEVASGVYFYQIQAGTYRAIRRMLVLK